MNKENEEGPPVGGEAGEVAEQLKGLQQIRFEGCQYGVISPEDAEKAAALIEKLARDRDEARNIVNEITALCMGFLPLDMCYLHPVQAVSNVIGKAGAIQSELSALKSRLDAYKNPPKGFIYGDLDAIKELQEAKARLDAPCEEESPIDEIYKQIGDVRPGSSLEVALYHADEAWGDLYRKWQEAQEQLQLAKAAISMETSVADAAKKRAAEAVARDSLDTIERVCFYEQEFYVLSNFSAFNLVWRNIRFSTSEAAYHWEKFPHDEKVRAAILNAKSAHDAFKCAEHFRAARRPDWDAVKVGVMREILRAKAEQHEYVRRKLLETGNRLLVENSWRDDFWGWGPNKDGRNMLGKLWMEIRAELRATAIRARSEGGGNG